MPVEIGIGMSDNLVARHMVLNNHMQLSGKVSLSVSQITL